MFSTFSVGKIITTVHNIFYFVLYSTNWQLITAIFFQQITIKSVQTKNKTFKIELHDKTKLIDRYQVN